MLQDDSAHTSGKFKLLSKKNAKFKNEMRAKLGYESPNKLDALMMCFYRSYFVDVARTRRKNVNKNLYNIIPKAHIS